MEVQFRNSTLVEVKLFQMTQYDNHISYKRGAINREKAVFLTYSNGIFTFYEYFFQDPDSYNSLVLIKQKKYSIKETKITFEDILEVLEKTKIVREPEIPFPQANSFKRVINLCELLNESELTRDE